MLKQFLDHGSNCALVEASFKQAREIEQTMHCGREQLTIRDMREKGFSERLGYPQGFFVGSFVFKALFRSKCNNSSAEQNNMH